jgi:hypothetical protein
MGPVATSRFSKGKIFEKGVRGGKQSALVLIFGVYFH